MSDKKTVMIDLETLSVKKNAAIIQIGAVRFDLQSDPCLTVYDQFQVNINLETALDAGLVTDQRTLDWWRKPENLKAYELTQSDSVGLYEALKQFRVWMVQDFDPEDIEVWANGTSFDLAILETAYRVSGLPHPWRFWNERDYRTLKCLYPDVAKPTFIGTKHCAVDDALNQAQHLAAIFLRMRAAAL